MSMPKQKLRSFRRQSTPRYLVQASMLTSNAVETQLISIWFQMLSKLLCSIFGYRVPCTRRLFANVATVGAIIVAASAPRFVNAQIPDVPGWQLSWHDAFDGNSLNTT